MIFWLFSYMYIYVYAISICVYMCMLFLPVYIHVCDFYLCGYMHAIPTCVYTCMLFLHVCIHVCYFYLCVYMHAIFTCVYICMLFLHVCIRVCYSYLCVYVYAAEDDTVVWRPYHNNYRCTSVSQNALDCAGLTAACFWIPWHRTDTSAPCHAAELSWTQGGCGEENAACGAGSSGVDCGTYWPRDW